MAGVGGVKVLAVERVKVQPPGRWVRGARLGWVWRWGEREGGEREGGWGLLVRDWGFGVEVVVMGRRRRREGRRERRGEGCIV